LSLAKFNKKSGFGTWIYRITYNACIDHKRKQKIIALPISGNNREIDQRFFVESRRSLEEKEIKQALKLLLEKLREDEQTMIQLHYMHGKNMAEIAEVMGISHGNVRKKMERTRFRLKEMFQNMFKNELSELL